MFSPKVNIFFCLVFALGIPLCFHRRLSKEASGRNGADERLSDGTGLRHAALTDALATPTSFRGNVPSVEDADGGSGAEETNADGHADDVDVGRTAPADRTVLDPRLDPDAFDRNFRKFGDEKCADNKKFKYKGNKKHKCKPWVSGNWKKRCKLSPLIRKYCRKTCRKCTPKPVKPPVKPPVKKPTKAPTADPKHPPGLTQRPVPYVYKYGTYTSFWRDLYNLAKAYPQFMTFHNAQTEYDLPFAGTGCNENKPKDPCYNHFVVIEDHERYKYGKFDAARRALPQILLLGEVHGDERVGPTAVAETARLLVLSAACLEHSHPRGRPSSAGKFACAELARHPEPWLLPWLARLVSTRRTVILPLGNAVGYLRQEREERGVDVNRDFAFDNLAGSCMNSVGARAINELFRRHLFQAGLAFHSGIEFLGYEWSSRGMHLNGYVAPDRVAFAQATNGLSRYAGAFANTTAYPQGQISKEIYGVMGGLNAWAYAASWSRQLKVRCYPTSTVGVYPASRTTYNNSVLRTSLTLVETSKEKTPPAATLGNDAGLFDPEGQGNGHIPRNLRIALQVVDTVEPYARIFRVNGRDLAPDIVPGRALALGRCARDNTISVRKKNLQNDGQLNVFWGVGGGYDVAETRLLYAAWNHLPSIFHCGVQVTEEDYAEFSARNTTRLTSPIAASGRWSRDELYDPAAETVDAGFSQTIDLKEWPAGSVVGIVAAARLDDAWGEVPPGSKYEDAPQSHLANARTNPEWRHKNAGWAVQGRLHWVSVPVRVEIR